MIFKSYQLTISPQRLPLLPWKSWSGVFKFQGLGAKNVLQFSRRDEAPQGRDPYRWWWQWRWHPLCQDEILFYVGKWYDLGHICCLKGMLVSWLTIFFDISFEIVLDRRWDATWNATEFLNVQYSVCFLKSGFDCTWKDKLLFKQVFSALLEGFEAFSCEQWSKAWLFSLNQGFCYPFMYSIYRCIWGIASHHEYPTSTSTIATRTFLYGFGCPRFS